MVWALHVKPEGFECAETDSKSLLYRTGTTDELAPLFDRFAVAKVLSWRQMFLFDTEEPLTAETKDRLQFFNDWCRCHRCTAARIILEEALARAEARHCVGAYLDRTLGTLWGREVSA